MIPFLCGHVLIFFFAAYYLAGVPTGLSLQSVMYMHPKSHPTIQRVESFAAPRKRDSDFKSLFLSGDSETLRNLARSLGRVRRTTPGAKGPMRAARTRTYCNVDGVHSHASRRGATSTVVRVGGPTRVVMHACVRACMAQHLRELKGDALGNQSRSLRRRNKWYRPVFSLTEGGTPKAGRT